MKSFFDDKHNTGKANLRTLKRGKTTVIVSGLRSLGITNVAIFADAVYFLLREKWLNKLFGKN